MLAPGTSVKFDVSRDGQSKTMTLTLGKRPDEEQAKADETQGVPDAGVPHLGLSLAPAGDVAGSGNKGVVVTGVDPNGLTADHGFQTGDMIVEVGGKAVATVSDIRNALTNAKADGKHNILMRVKRATQRGS